jgi:hypothetical protein
MDRHVRVLAALYIAGGIAGLITGCMLLLKIGAISKFLLALMSTQLIMSVPFAAMYLNALGWLHVVLAVPAIISGWGLRRYDEWARMMGMVVALAGMLSFPFGTIAGVYGIWVLLAPESEYLFLEPPGTPAGKTVSASPRTR